MAGTRLRSPADLLRCARLRTTGPLYLWRTTKAAKCPRPLTPWRHPRSHRAGGWRTPRTPPGAPTSSSRWSSWSPCKARSIGRLNVAVKTGNAKGLAGLIAPRKRAGRGRLQRPSNRANDRHSILEGHLHLPPITPSAPSPSPFPSIPFSGPSTPSHTSSLSPFPSESSWAQWESLPLLPPSQSFCILHRPLC